VQGLAKCIAWDGEGATCLMEIEVTGAASDADARTVAKSVAGSSLAKSAIFGHDPNWGRIAAAAGYSGEQLQAAGQQQSRVVFQAIYLCWHCMTGQRVRPCSYLGSSNLFSCRRSC
jgi:N-acetylglutamate synthase/N-acetylornithine aminotransferase